MNICYVFGDIRSYSAYVKLLKLAMAFSNDRNKFDNLARIICEHNIIYKHDFEKWIGFWIEVAGQPK